jgi:UDP-GlcNAc3NAcA epimerase
MRVLTVVGNRPQLVKAAAVSPPLRKLAEETIVHSGQHYDRELSAVFFEELGIPLPDHDLAVGSGSHARQTAMTMTRLEPLLEQERPDAVLVYGDTNTTLAAALVAAKMPLPLVHVEAGMRSFDGSMPEEVNRVAVDCVSDLLLCSTETALENLRAEGLAERARVVGDVMADVARRFGPIAERGSRIHGRLGLRRGEYIVATLHRAANVDDGQSLRRAVDLLAALAAELGPLVFVVHPRTEARLTEAGLMSALEADSRIVVSRSLGYLDFTALIRGSRAVLTDSGGLQKEAYLAGVPCVTLRLQTEWLETVTSGWNRLVGLDAETALRALGELIARRRDESPDLAIYGDGRAGERCARELVSWVEAATAP